MRGLCLTNRDAVQPIARDGHQTLFGNVAETLTKSRYVFAVAQRVEGKSWEQEAKAERQKEDCRESTSRPL
jgi:hypothetical protein